MGFDKEGYWSPREILGYGSKYMIVLSDRGRGKTVSLKDFMIQQKGEFMALYRDSADMAHAIQSWTDDLIRYKGYTAEAFEFEGSEKDGFSLKYHGAVKGYFRYLSAVNHIKQEGFPDTLNYVWLDEFIPMVYKKLQGVKSEGDALRTILKTIDHDSAHPRETRGYKKLRCFLVGNPHNWNNPLLSYFHVEPGLGYGLHRIGPDIVLEHIEPLAEEEKKGPQTVDEFLGEEVHKADGWRAQTGFIHAVPRGSVPEVSLRLGRRYYGVLKASSGDMYVKEYSGHCCSRRYGTTDGMVKGEQNICGSVILKAIEKRVLNGGFMYESVNTKFNFQNDLEEV